MIALLARVGAMIQQRCQDHLVGVFCLAVIGLTGVVGIIILGCLGRSIPAELAVIASAAGGAIGGALRVGQTGQGRDQAGKPHDGDSVIIKG